MRVLLADLQELIKADDLEIGLRLLDLLQVFLDLVVLFAVVDDDLEGLDLGGDGGEGAQKVGVGEETDDFGLVERVLEALLAERVVGGRKGDRLRGTGW